MWMKIEERRRQAAREAGKERENMRWRGKRIGLDGEDHKQSRTINLTKG